MTTSYIDYLPVKPGQGASSDIITAYQKQLREVSSAEQLALFVTQWRAVWNLRFAEDDIPTQEEQILIEGSCDYDRIFMWLQCMLNTDCNSQSLDAQIAEAVIMPRSLLISMISSKGLTGTDEGLSVLYTRGSGDRKVT